MLTEKRLKYLLYTEAKPKEHFAMETKTSRKPIKLMFVVDDWICVRDYIRGRLLPAMANDPEVEIVVATKFGLQYVPQELASKGVRFVEFKMARPTWWSRLIRGIADYIFIAEHPEGTLYYKKHTENMRKGKNISHRFFWSKLLRGLGIRSDRLMKLQERDVDDPVFRKILEDEKPDLMIFTSVLPFKSESLKEARKKGIKTLLALSYWDQATSKGPLAFKPDYVLAWSEEMKSEVMSHHYISPEKIFIQGVLYFDLYFQNPRTIDRETYCKQLGIDPKKKIILYAMGSSRMVLCNLPFLEILSSMAKQGAFGPDTHLLVRVSPKDGADGFAQFRNQSHCTVVFPKGILDEKTGHWFPDDEEEIDRLMQIKYADVVVCMSSTFILDALCLDVPVVNLAYDANREVPSYESVERFFRYTHAKPVLEEDGTWMVKSDEDLIQAITTYLQKPDIRREKQENMLKRIVTFTDGKTYERWIRIFKEIGNNIARQTDHSS